jgi:hypothetical protein
MDIIEVFLTQCVTWQTIISSIRIDFISSPFSLGMLKKLLLDKKE